MKRALGTRGNGRAKDEEPVVIKLKVHGQTHRIDYETAFSHAHTLVRNGHPIEAADICKALLRIRPKDRQAKLMLAQCKAAQEHYGACLEILDAVFKRAADRSMTSEFHTAFVFRAMGMMDEAARQMHNVVSRHKDMPTACLFLGDTLAAAGRNEAAEQCWKLAIKRDRRNGSVARTARKQIRALKKRSARSRGKRTK